MTDVTEYVVVVVGDTWRPDGAEKTVCVTPSDQVTSHGEEPVRASGITAERVPSQIVALPEMVARSETVPPRLIPPVNANFRMTIS